MKFRLLLLLLLVACPTSDDDDSAIGDDDDSTVSADDDDATQTFAQEEGTLEATNSAGRNGAFFLPERSGPVPLLVLYHHTGGDGASMVAQLRDLAVQHGFAIVAPDSRVSPGGDYTWEVGTFPGELTEDYTFTLTCIDEVTDRDDVELAAERLLVAGHSGGASSAPWIASNEERFTAFAVLHGGVVEGGIGDHFVPGWFSTGEDDTVRPPEHVEAAMQYMQGLGFDELELHLYPGGHGLGDQEKADLVDWWLKEAG